MYPHTALILRKVLLFLFAFACLLLPPISAQNFIPPSPVPPNLGFLPGLSTGQSESVNPVAGNLTLSFQAGALPPGPGGFSTSVNLTYNSAFYTSSVDTSGGPNANQLRILYGNEANGGAYSGIGISGGWGYSFRYNLWAASKPVGQTAGYTTYLTTPDGTNHILLLVSAVKPDGNPASSAFHQNYSDQPIYDVNFAGLCANSNDTACTQWKFNGTLVFVSADSSYIRLESDTVAKTWIAYFADGTKVSGTFNLPAGNTGEQLAAMWNKIEDKNGNTLELDNFCMESSTCTTKVTDQYGREVDIEYGSFNNFPWNWTDTISQPGVNGRVNTVVNWIMNEFSGPSYDCIYVSPGTFTTCPLTGVVTPYVVESIQLPSGTNGGPSTVYTFNYDVPSGSRNWGELHTMKRKALIAGANISSCLLETSASCPQQYQAEYAYYFDNPTRNRVMGTLVNPVSTKTLTYSENRDGTITQLPPETTNYAIPVPTSFDPTKPPPVGGTSVVTAPDGSQTTIYSGRSPSCTNEKSGLCPSFVYKVVNPDGTMTETAWASSALPPGTLSGIFANPYAQYTIQTIGAKAKGVSTLRDSNGNTTSTGEYNWFNASSVSRTNGVITGIPGSPTRTTSSTFYATTAYWNRDTRYLRALNTTSVGTASTTNYYDNALTTGNLTYQLSWNSESNSNISRSWAYAANGNLLTETDPNGIVTKTTYDASSLYPTQVDVAFGRPEQRTQKPTYSFNSGLLLSSVDDNNHVTVTTTYDNVGRPKKVEQWGNGGLYRSSSTIYDDVAFSSTTTQDQSSLSSTTHYDSLGRVRLTIDSAGAKIQKAYRTGASGISYELESNPYTTIGQSMGWTLTIRNSITAVATVQTYKGADPPAPWGSAGTSNLTGTTTTVFNDQSLLTCAGPTINVTDQANRTTKNCQDGLGRLAGVTDAAGNLTQYEYNLLDNLTKVTQSGKTRAFEYSSLGRLLKACNPETGTASCSSSPLPDTGLEKYTYDPGGNLMTKKDARSITTTYSGYDGLNRPQIISYTKSDGSPEGTPTVTYSYDQGWKGALSSVGTPAFSTSYTYDGFGRIKTSTQTKLPGTAYAFTYTYSLADQLTKIQYPSGRIVNYVPDNGGRISAVKNEATNQYYASNISYTPVGALSTMTLGNGVVEQQTWNDRLQLTRLTATGQGGSSVLDLGFYPCPGLATSCSNGNTGSIQGQIIAFPGFHRTQDYTYDILERLASVNEGTTNWKRGYGYDAVGNRFVDPDPAKTSGYALSSFTPTSTSNFDSNNRLGVNGSTYDPSGNGNQTAIGGYTYTYDAENRIITANLSANGTAVSSAGYVYDGQGQRVQKITCPAGTNLCNASVSGATSITYVYDASGNLAAEYGGSSGAQDGCGTLTCYLSVDQIGSTRLVTDANGNVVRRYDFSPFGEELWAGTGGRTTAMGYQSAPDGFSPKFTGQHRDTENFLDYFHARYYSPQQGRFVSVDPGNAGATLESPQTWNGYAYVNNNPLNYTDPSGEGIFGTIFGILAGIFTANPWIGLAASAAGNGIDAAIWGPEAAGIPWGNWGGGIPNVGRLPNLGDLAGCGGPLGNCGTLGAGPWSEGSGLEKVKDPGRFVFNVDPNKIEAHHVFSQAKVLQAWFRDQGIDIEKYKILLPAGVHRLTAFKGIHTGPNSWNALWYRFKSAVPNASADEMFEQASKMVKHFKIGGFPGGGTFMSAPIVFFNPCILDPYLSTCRLAGESPKVY